VTNARSRTKNAKPGRITVRGVGAGRSGPADDARRNRCWCNADVDVRRPRRARRGAGHLIGSELHKPSGRAGTRPPTPPTAHAPEAVVTGRRRRRRPALGAPAEVVKTLVAEARSRRRRRAAWSLGDPLSAGLGAGRGQCRRQEHRWLVRDRARAARHHRRCPATAGMPLGSSHTVADVRGDVDWAALAAAPGPLDPAGRPPSILPIAARALTDYGLSAADAGAWSPSQGTTCATALGGEPRSPG
jgi:uroporphyrinogen III methyltransferase/synthase